jgi:hypothetical protein
VLESTGKYPVDLGDLLFPIGQIYWVSRTLTRRGRVQVAIQSRGKLVGLRSTSLPMIWACIHCLDIPVRIAALQQLISDRLAEAAWWDRIQQADPVALEEHAQRSCFRGKPSSWFLEDRQAKIAQGVFIARATRCRQEAELNQKLQVTLQSTPEQRIVVVQSWHRRPYEPRQAGVAGLSVEVLKIRTQPDYVSTEPDYYDNLEDDP